MVEIESGAGKNRFQSGIRECTLPSVVAGASRVVACTHVRACSLAVYADGRGRRDEEEKESAYGLRGAHTFYFYFARWITREE